MKQPLLKKETTTFTEAGVTDKEKELIEYDRAITTLAEHREAHSFENEGNEHALLVFRNIFSNAQNIVCIVAHDLTNKEVSNSESYINALRGFLEKEDVKLRVMLTSYTPETARETRVFRTIYDSKAFKNGNVQIYNLNGKRFRNGDGNPIHFCLADGSMYRIETNVSERKAQCDFNDPDMVAAMSRHFEKGVSLDTTEIVSLGDVFVD